ncbi:MAG: hypothetical protein N3E51_03720 [Candidatus Micrarchaeota archaeon]|nr:hypothetical protein [Candidatus Micrarchaeota archaeon]
MEEESIRTQFDDLLSALKGAQKPLSVRQLSSVAAMSEKDVLKWLHILEQQGVVRLENRLSGVYASYTGELRAVPQKPMADGSQIDAKKSAIYQHSDSFERELQVAREREENAKGRLSHLPPVPQPSPQRHKVEIAKADMELAQAAAQLEKVEAMLSALREQKRLAKEKREKAQKAAPQSEAQLLQAEKDGMTIITDETAEERREGGLEEEKKEQQLLPAAQVSQQPEKPQTASAEKAASAPEPIVLNLEEITEQKTQPSQPKPQPAADMPEAEAGENEPELRIRPEQENPPQEAPAKDAAFSASREKELKEALEHLAEAGRKRGRASKIKKPQPVEVAGVATQFSERLHRQVQRIVAQMQSIDKLRLEKERLLTEHYLPMQRRLESEIETISDRVLRMERSIVGMQERAANLPGKVQATEKLQLQSIKAHSQMRRAYDEACALLEEAGRELGEERQKLEALAEQSRQEIASHQAKTLELEKSLSQISQLEQEVSEKVLEARAAVAQQAERLASAEKYARELSELKGEIKEGIAAIKRELGAAKGTLGGIERQLEQMRQVEIYADSLRKDYDAKMAELSDYIAKGNEDFELLRESVEANFVRRYLKELRELTESYSFEFSQAKRLEADIDKRIEQEKNALEQLIDEAKRIAHLYELQGRQAEGAERFEEHGKRLEEIEKISQKRTQIEQMIAKIVGARQESAVKSVASSPIAAQAVTKGQRERQAAAAGGAKRKKRLARHKSARKRGSKRRS